MKVVINKCYGGFGLSDEAIEECIRRGMTVTEYGDRGYKDDGADFVRNEPPSFGHRYYPINANSHRFRCHPTVVAVVEEMGSRADGDCAELKVIDIPFSGPDGWQIDEYDGIEHVEPVHERWG